MCVAHSYALGVLGSSFLSLLCYATFNGDATRFNLGHPEVLKSVLLKFFLYCVRPHLTGMLPLFIWAIPKFLNQFWLHSFLLE